MAASEFAVDRTFALLGPGFGRGSWLLATELRPVATTGASSRASSGPLLVFAPFEAAGAEANLFEAGLLAPIRLLFDLDCPAIDVELDDRGYLDNVERIRSWIAAGDVYQVCYTLRARVEAAVAPASDGAGPGPEADARLDGAALLARMCRRGVPRFAAWARLPGHTEFVSASPELFLSVNGRRVRSEPMKGTAGRDAAGSLEASEKERAELAMITDLVRNDLASVCVPRSVGVACRRRRVRLPYAVQTVSDVIAELPDGASPIEVLAALHPGGSVTGAPKSTALEAIRRLEPTPRGAYCGALGLWRGDRAVFSLLIRTATRASEGWSYGVGSGIVYDSVAENELAELHVKLGALTGSET